MEEKSYRVNNISFSAEEKEYLKEKAELYFSHAPAYGRFDIESDGSLWGEFGISLPDIKGDFQNLLWPFMSKMMILGGFEFKRIGSRTTLTKELRLARGEYEAWDNLSVCFTQKQASGKVALFKLHANPLRLK